MGQENDKKLWRRKSAYPGVYVRTNGSRFTRVSLMNATTLFIMMIITNINTKILVGNLRDFLLTMQYR